MLNVHRGRIEVAGEGLRAGAVRSTRHGPVLEPDRWLEVLGSMLDGDVEMKVKKSRTEIDATPIGGRIVNLFRSDYTDYKTPGSIDFATNALLAVEFYSADAEEIVFSFDHQTKKDTNLGLLIDQTAETIVRRIDREGLLAN